MAARKTSVVIDEELLTSVQDALATRTVKDTIEQAFLEVLRARARRAEIQVLATMEEMDLANAVVMGGAWRH